MWAPRACACSSASRMRTPAPSPMMKPSRSLSNGRHALSGASLRVESARMAAKPPSPMWVMAASEPPAIIASAAPRRISSAASPMACADAEQAVAVAEFGPLAPNRIDTWPAARLMIAEGMKNGGGKKKGGGGAGPAVKIRFVPALEGADPADAGADEDADPRRQRRR